MELLSENNIPMVNMEFDFSEEETKFFIKYAADNMPTEEFDRLSIEWSILDILKRELGIY